MASYTITVNNKSSAKQHYAIFAEPPIVSHAGIPDTGITSRIIMSAQGVATGKGQASFILSKQYYAICGTYDVDSNPISGNGVNSGTVGSGIEVIDQKPVSLGHYNGPGDENVVYGSSLEANSNDGYPPSFSTSEIPAGGEIGCFSIRTTGDFKLQQAQLKKFVLGYSSSLRHAIGPYATFVPAPNQVYQIKPSPIFYVTIGAFNVRDGVKDSLKNSPRSIRVDFTKLATDEVQIVHNDYGHLAQISQDGLIEQS